MRLSAMNAVSLDTNAFDDDAPLTERAPAISIARLIARTRDDDTVTRTPPIDLLAMSNAADGEAIERMRTLYANGEAEEALAVAATIAPDDGYGGLIVVTDEVLDMAIRDIDRACLDEDPEVVDLDAIFQDDVVQLDEPFEDDLEELDSDFLELDLS